MANQGTENPEQDVQQDAEFDTVLERFEKNESSRRRKVAVLALVLVVVGVGIFLAAVVFRQDLFGPGVDIEKIDKEITLRTNDPQCREMIAQVGALGERYFKLEPQLDSQILGEDPAALNAIREDIARLQQRTDEISEFSQQSNLRYDQSRQQLDDWFKYVTLELSFIDRLARDQLAEIEAKSAASERADAGTQTGTEHADAGAAGVVVAEHKDNAKKAAQTQTPLERKRAALVALHDAFQKFRIWHTASAHPCGAADKGEIPWKPAPSDSPQSGK